MSPEAIVYIVDDDEGSRYLLKCVLESVGLESRAFASAKEFLDAYIHGVPACLLLDVRMPIVSGLELQEDLKSRYDDLPVIIVTGHSDTQVAVRAMKAGAFDFIEKPIKDQIVLETVAKALEKSRDSLAHHKRISAVRTRLESLTPREHEVLDQIKSGNLNKQIAYHLGISERTVEVHRGRVMKKMNARSLPDLITMVIGNQLSTG